MTFFGLFVKLAEVASAPEPRERMHRALFSGGMLTCCRCLRPIRSQAVAITDGEGRKNYHAGCVPAAPDDYSGTGEVRDVRRLFRKPYYLRPELVLNSQFILFAPPCSIMPCGDYYIGLVAMGIKSYFYRYGDPARVLERMGRLLAKTKRTETRS